MKYGDLTSLFQLGVALNLGFGALISFVEPVKQKRDNAIFMIESELVTLSERHEIGEPTEIEIEDIFDIIKKYRMLYFPNLFSRLEDHFWDGLITRIIFVICGVTSFICLIGSSVSADDAARLPLLVIGILANIPPIIVALLMLAISLWYTREVFPIIDEVQSRLFRYRPYFRSSVSHSGAHEPEADPLTPVARRA